MNNNIFSEHTAIKLVNEKENEFPVPFDGLWQWVGYSTKGNALRKLKTSRFQEDKDFCSFIRNDKRAIGATVIEDIFLTVDAAKKFCLLANTEQGDEVRDYFIAAEKKARELLQEQLDLHQITGRAKTRVEVTEINKQVANLAHDHGTSYGKLHNDRYTGLYGKTAAELRAEIGIGKKKTPLNYMSGSDLTLQKIVNEKALEIGDPDKVYELASGFKEVIETASGKQLTPNWEKDKLSPDKARSIISKQAKRLSGTQAALSFPEYN